METQKSELSKRASENERANEKRAEDLGAPNAESAERSVDDDAAKKISAKKKRQKNNVRKLRMERMMSKAELARRAGLSTLTIDRVERGLECRMDTKRKILEALGLTPSDRVSVFGEEE